MEQQNNKLEESIEEILKFKEKLTREAENSEDVKNGKCTVEDEKAEPAYMLYNAISESSIDILQQPSVVNLFAKISEKMGDEMAKNLVELFAISMTRSAYNAITFYDQLLKGELTRQFDNYGEHLNATTATVKAHDGVIEVLSKKISAIENELRLQKAKDNLK